VFKLFTARATSAKLSNLAQNTTHRSLIGSGEPGAGARQTRRWVDWVVQVALNLHVTSGPRNRERQLVRADLSILDLARADEVPGLVTERARRVGDVPGREGRAEGSREDNGQASA
jgi:hypothetical protein